MRDLDGASERRSVPLAENAKIRTAEKAIANTIAILLSGTPLTVVYCACWRCGINHDYGGSTAFHAVSGQWPSLCEPCWMQSTPQARFAFHCEMLTVIAWRTEGYEGYREDLNAAIVRCAHIILEEGADEDV